MCKKKIMIISNHSFMLYRFRKNLIEALRKTYDVIIVVPFGDNIDDLQTMGCKCIDISVDRRGINPIKDYKLYREYMRVIAKYKPCKVITYSIKPNIYAGYVARKKGIEYYANVQGMGTAFEKKGLAVIATKMYRIALKKAKRVFFENSYDARTFQDRNIVMKNQVVVLPGAGIDLEQYPYEPYINKDSFHFLYMGRIMKEKGIDEIIEASRRLYSEHKFVLDIVGFCEDGYERQIKELERQGIIDYHGFQPDPKPYYKNADCIVMPSYHEGMSNVNLEAAATGRVIITTDIPGCREAVDDGETGFLVKPRDADSLYERMHKVMSMDSLSLEKMGLLARAKMERQFEKNLVVRLTIDALNVG